MIRIENHGPLIVESDYWDSALASAGKFYVSTNAGFIRVMVPQSRRRMIEDVRGSEYAILSRGPWPSAGLPEGVEILFEDTSDAPYMLNLSPESFDLLPAEPPPGREWVIALWTSKRGRPHKSLERVCHWRRVSSIPCLQLWGEGE